MGMSIDQSYDEIKRHILTSDPTYRVWEFGKPSNLGPDFQSGDFTVSVIDPFGGKIPRLISYKTIMGQLPPSPSTYDHSGFQCDVTTSQLCHAT